MTLHEEIELLYNLEKTLRQSGSQAMMRLWIDTEDTHKFKVLRKVSPVGFTLHDEYAFIIEGFGEIASIGINSNMKWKEFEKVSTSITFTDIISCIEECVKTKNKITGIENECHKEAIACIHHNSVEFIKNFIVG